MFFYVKKVVDFIFMKKKTPSHLYSNRADQERINCMFMDDLMFDDDDAYQDMEPHYDPIYFEHHNDFEKVPSYGHPRICSIGTDSDVVKENDKANVIRSVSNYALHALEQSRYILSMATKSLNKAHPNKETENKSRDVNKNDNKNDYNSLNETIDQGEHCQTVPKAKEINEEDFELVKNLEEVINQQEYDEANNEEEYDLFYDAIDQEDDFQIISKAQETQVEDFEFVESAQEITNQQECDETNNEVEYDFIDNITDLGEQYQVVSQKQEIKSQEFNLAKRSQKMMLQQEIYPIDNLVREFSRLYPMEVEILDLSKVSRYRYIRR